MRVIVFSIISILAFCGCKEQKVNTMCEPIKFHYEERDNLNFKDVFKKPTIIPLETNEKCLLSRISKMEIADNRIFILDNKLKVLLCFSEKGKFLNKIGTKGRGPGEYIHPADFFICKKDSLVKVYDSRQKKIICFDFNGKFKGNIMLHYCGSRVGQIESHYWEYCSNFRGNSPKVEEENILKFKTFSLEGTLLKQIFGDKVIDKLNLSNAYCVSDLDETVSFVEPYNPYIYSFDGTQVKKKFYLDFSGHFPSKRILSQCEKLDYPLNSHETDKLDMVTKKYPVFILEFFENKNWILLRTQYKNATVLYNKKSKKTNEFRIPFFEKDSWETFCSPCYIQENCIYCSADYTLFDNLSKQGNISEKRKKSLLGFMKGMRNDANPIIIKYTINE